MKKTGLATMSISIDGMKETHDKFRGVPGAFVKTINNIKKLQNDKFLKAFQITTVVNKMNISELDEMHKLMKNLEVDSWRIINMDPIGRAQDNNDLALNKNDYIYLFNFMEKTQSRIYAIEQTGVYGPPPTSKNSNIINRTQPAVYGPAPDPSISTITGGHIFSIVASILLFIIGLIVILNKNIKKKIKVITVIILSIEIIISLLLAKFVF